MRWDYPPLDINPVFSGLGYIIIIIIIIIILTILWQLHVFTIELFLWLFIKKAQAQFELWITHNLN